MVYLTPVVSLGWLFILSIVGDVNAAWLLGGSALIIGVNIAAYFEGEAAAGKLSGVEGG